MFGGTTLVRTRLVARHEDPWWLPFGSDRDEAPPSFASRDEEGSEDLDDEEDGDGEEEDDDLEEDDLDDEDLDDEDADHECPWCAEPCACAFGPDPGEYDGEALDCCHECADDASDAPMLGVSRPGAHDADLSSGRGDGRSDDRQRAYGEAGGEAGEQDGSHGVRDLLRDGTSPGDVPEARHARGRGGAAEVPGLQASRRDARAEVSARVAFCTTDTGEICPPGRIAGGGERDRARHAKAARDVHRSRRPDLGAGQPGRSREGAPGVREGRRGGGDRAGGGAEGAGGVRERELSFEERMRWGDCPACEVPDGEPCHAEIGVHLGIKVDGSRMRTGEGVHMGRLARAPFRVKEVPA